MCSPKLFNAKHNKLLPLFVIKVAIANEQCLRRLKL